MAALPSPQGLLGSVAHSLQKALQGAVSAVTWAPAAVLGTAGRVLRLTPARAAPHTSSAKGRAMSLSDALKGVTDNVVDTVVHYVPVSPCPLGPSRLLGDSGDSALILSVRETF